MYYKRDGQAPENVQTATITIWGKILNFHTHNVFSNFVVAPNRITS